MTDILTKLHRAALPDPHDEREVTHGPLLREAREEIERLMQELKLLKNEFYACADTLGSKIVENAKQRNVIDVKDAEIERMTEALESIAANTCCDSCQEAALVARAALAKEDMP